jgi:hypothetical protein
MSASGTFEIQLDPQEDKLAPVGRMIINKTYSGALTGTGTGQMISKKTTNNTAAYSAIEEFNGDLDGKSGQFTLIHHGFMSEKNQVLDITILEGSGTDELTNISGSLSITQEKGQHYYELTYQCPNN